MSGSRFKKPGKPLNSIPELTDTGMSALLGDKKPSRPAATSKAPEMPTPSNATESGGKIVLKDTRHKSEVERQDAQLIVRMTQSEKAAIVQAFEQSGFRYQNQFLRMILQEYVRQNTQNE